MMLIKRRIKRQPKPLSRPQSLEETKSVIKEKQSLFKFKIIEILICWNKK
jgi:hypothetical protein